MSTGFDFSVHVRRLCDGIVERLDEFAHIDMSRVAIRTCQVRQTGRFGMQASLTPLRFCRRSDGDHSPPPAAGPSNGCSIRRAARCFTC